jgi:hypothetical protein
MMIAQSYKEAFIKAGELGSYLTNEVLPMKLLSNILQETH